MTEEVKDRIAHEAGKFATEPAFSGGIVTNQHKRLGYIAGALSEHEKAINDFKSALRKEIEMALNEQVSRDGTSWTDGYITATQEFLERIDSLTPPKQ